MTSLPGSSSLPRPPKEFQPVTEPLSDRNTRLFEGLRLWVLPLGAPSQVHVARLLDLWTLNGGIVVENGYAPYDFLLSQLPRPKVLGKLQKFYEDNPRNEEILWIDIRWVNECLKKNQICPAKSIHLVPSAKKLKVDVKANDAAILEEDETDTQCSTDLESSKDDTGTSSPSHQVPVESASRDRSPLPNDRIISELSKMMARYKASGKKEQWRLNSYRKAIMAIKLYDGQIRNGKHAMTLPGVGKSIATKIDEILATGHLQQAESVIPESEKVIGLYSKVYGVGDKIAQSWYDRGWRTLDDIREHRSELTKDQQLGIDHYEDLNQTIPKEEMLAYRDVVAKSVHAVHPEFQVYLVGSYRREEASFNDVDFIITHRDDSFSSPAFVPLIIKEMKNRDVEVIDLGLEHAEHKLYKGICRLPGFIYRRMDILMVPIHELGASLIYFTGNDLFNRRIRSLATSKGMKLNQHGLFRVENGQLTERLAGETERSVFDALGLLSFLYCGRMAG